MGGTGCISVVANVVPQLVKKMVDSALREDFKEARRVHHKLGELSRAMFMETNPIPVKAALEKAGYGNGNLRSPLSEISQKNRKKLLTILSEYEYK
jgi:4-hydroxy-tetrahydrodipicolinate synthase